VAGPVAAEAVIEVVDLQVAGIGLDTPCDMGSDGEAVVVKDLPVNGHDVGVEGHMAAAEEEEEVVVLRELEVEGGDERMKQEEVTDIVVEGDDIGVQEEQKEVVEEEVCVCVCVCLCVCVCVFFFFFFRILIKW
jgi:hypothetical protein